MTDLFVIPREKQWESPVDILDANPVIFNPDNNLVYAFMHSITATGTLDFNFYKGTVIAETVQLTNASGNYLIQGVTRIEATAPGAAGTAQIWSN